LLGFYDIRKKPQEMTGKRHAWIGLIAGIVIFPIAAGLVVWRHGPDLADMLEELKKQQQTQNAPAKEAATELVATDAVKFFPAHSWH
jgi:hypothetical protein